MDSTPDTLPPASRAPAEAPPAEPLIALEDVHLTVGNGAGEVNILRGIDLTVAAGESLAIVGPSGSGKSTLMMVMGGLEKATAGSVRVGGEGLTGLSEDDLARFRRQRIGIVFQAFHLVPTMTAVENVALPLELAGARDAFSRATEELRLLGLAHRLRHYPSQLSGGEQQRVALARAFVAQPSLLLADEPTGNLDSQTGAAVMDLLFDLHDRRGTTLILITHDLALAERCDRTLHLADGRVAMEAPGKASQPPLGTGVTP